MTLLFVGAIISQVFFAGATLLVDPRYLIDHRALGENMWQLPLLLVVLSMMARLPRRFMLLSVLLLVLYVMQYAVIHIFPSLGLPTVFRGLHAINALVMFWTAVYVVKSVRSLIRNPVATD